MESGGKRIDDLIYKTNFPAIRIQAQEMDSVQKAGHANNVTYIQAGELWFGTLCISLFALFAVFVYALLYQRTLYKKKCLYDKVVFMQGRVQTVGMSSDDEEEDGDEADIEQENDAMRATAEHILPIWSCVVYLVCMVLLSAHSLGRVLYSYKKELHERTGVSTMQVSCSALCWIASTSAACLYTWNSRADTQNTRCLSWKANFLLYKLHRESVWSLHAVTTVLLLDDILTMVAVTSYDAASQTGTSLTNLLYIWLGLFTLYIVVFLVLDMWLNKEEVVILPYMMMVIILCEIPTRNYKSMSEDPASLGTSSIGLLILMCLTARLVHGWTRKGCECVPHFKSD